VLNYAAHVSHGVTFPGSLGSLLQNVIGRVNIAVVDDATILAGPFTLVSGNKSGEKGEVEERQIFYQPEFKIEK